MIQVVVPDPASALFSSNTELEQILQQTELKPTEQIATDAPIALALQMETHMLHFWITHMLHF